MQFLERNGQPLLIGFGPDPAQVAAQLRNALMDAVVGMPLEGKVESVSPSNKGEAFEKIEQALVRRIQKVILGQTLTSDTGAGGVGSKALGDIHNEVRSDKTTADVELIKPTIQRYVNAIYLVNFPGQEPPNVVYSIERGLEVGRATRDATLINTGTVKFSKDYYIREYGFKDTDIEIIDKVAASTPSDPTAPSDQNKQKQAPKPAGNDPKQPSDSKK
jgi:hypothetical protein